MAAVTGDDEDNLVICQMAKHHFDVPRTIARVNNPKNEALFRHLGVDELISPTRMILGSIEQDIPVHELLHLAALGEGELELIEAHLQAGSPAIGRAPKDLAIPEGCSLFAVIRDGIATPLRPDTVMLEGDKVIAIGKTECQALLHDQLIGDPEVVARGLIPGVRGGGGSAGEERGQAGPIAAGLIPTPRQASFLPYADPRPGPPGTESQCQEAATLLTTPLSTFYDAPMFPFEHIQPGSARPRRPPDRWRPSAGARSRASRLRDQRRRDPRECASADAPDLRGRRPSVPGTDPTQHPPL